MAQSVAGGGGVSATTLSGGSLALSSSYIGGQSATVNGQSVGTSGDGQAVTVNQTGAITTTGPAAIGIVAQSVGGGGGYVGLVSQSSTAASGGSMSIGGSSNSSGNGGNVNVTVGAAINTSGNSAVGVLAQSVGGGGGALVTAGVSGVAPTFAGGSGSSGNVTVTVNAPITTRGAGAYGVLAQSVAGGGGLMINENGVTEGTGHGSGTAGAVSVVNNSQISVSGSGAKGIFATNTVSGSADPSVVISSGASVTASEGATAIVLNGLVNSLRNDGAITVANAATDMAIEVRGDGGVTELINNGVITGRIINSGNNSTLTAYLGNSASGSNINLTNVAGARMYLPEVPNLGNGVMTNSGYVQFSHAVEQATTTIAHTESFVQTATGSLGTRLDFAAAASDLHDASNSALFSLDGKIRPVLVNAGLIHPGTVQTKILSSGGSVGGLQGVSSSLGIDENSAIMSYALTRTATDMTMSSTANFAPAGLSQFGNQVGQAIGSYQSAGSNAFFQAATAQLVNVPDVSSLDQAYQGLAGTAIQAVPQAVYQAVSQGIGSYTDRMNDWRVSSATSKSSRQAAFYQLPQRYVANQNTQSMVDAATDSSLIPNGRSGPWVSLFQSNVFSNSLTDRIFGGSLAYEVESDQRDMLGGVGLTMSQSGYSYNSAPTPITPGNSTNVGLSFYGIGRGDNAYLSGIGYLGGGNSNFSRQLQTMNFYTSTNVNIMSYVAAARVEAGYSFEPFRNERSNMKLTPFVAVQPTYIHQKGAQENFSGLGAGFNYAANDNTAVPVFAGLELSGNHRTESGTRVSPFIRASWMAETQQKGQMGASYSGNQGVSLYYSGAPSLGNAMQYKVGSVFNADEKVSGYVTLDYDYGNGSYNYRAYGATLGVKYAF